MPHQVKVFAAKPEDLHLIPRILHGRREATSHKLSFTFHTWKQSIINIILETLRNYNKMKLRGSWRSSCRDLQFFTSPAPENWQCGLCLEVSGRLSLQGLSSFNPIRTHFEQISPWDICIVSGHSYVEAPPEVMGTTETNKKLSKRLRS